MQYGGQGTDPIGEDENGGMQGLQQLQPYPSKLRERKRNKFHFDGNRRTCMH